MLIIPLMFGMASLTHAVPFTVDNSTLVVTGGRVGLSTATPQTTLDVNGSAQFGLDAGKSTFTASPGGSTYALQLSSGVTISSGGIVNLSTGGFIRFSNGSTLAAAPTSGGVANSTRSVTLLTVTSFTGSTLGKCVSGSSVTITSSGTVRLSYSGTIYNGTDSQNGLAVLMDGAFLPNFTAGRALVNEYTHANTVHSVAFNYQFTPSSGSHTFCLTAATSAGTLKVPDESGFFNTLYGSQFGVEQLP